jgi:RNA-directed DNA polymerase
MLNYYWCFTAKKGGILVNVRNSTTLISEKRTDKDLKRQWNSIDWKKVRSYVNRLQTRIAKATHEGKWNLVKRLQYLLTNSHSAKLLAVRIVTQNRGSRTPGIDGVRWLRPHEKMWAALSITRKRYTAQPLKRIYIPKPGKKTKRPLSIPTMYDRTMQALYALALQPVAETKADNRSFGFRLSRSTQDASQYAFLCLHHPNSAPWILEGDIKGCFDNISHEWLKENIPMEQSVLSQFLKAGYVFEQNLYHTDKGTPQGGLISPILANMALDGIEGILYEQYPDMKVHFIRYADDFLVTAPSREVAEEICELIRVFLAGRGLELSKAKTLITHINDGFDFLGWSFRKYGGTLLIKPSRESIKKITDKVSKIIQKAAAWTQEQLIKALNPVIIGWANYHRHIVAKETFQKLDNIIWNMLWKWAKRRHPKKGHKWIVRRYWYTESTRNWVFKAGMAKLVLFADTKIRRHVMVKLDKNPFLDRNYFLDRLDRVSKYTPWIQTRLSFFAYRRPKFGL